jgi:hypothetical protein
VKQYRSKAMNILDKSTLYIGALLLLSAISTICGAQNNSNSKDSILTHKYYFELSIIQEKQFIHNMGQIAIGDSLKKVIHLLGKPDYDQDMARKTNHKNKKRDFISRDLSYYMKKWEKNMVNEKHDKYVNLRFDIHNILFEIYSNVDSIPNSK